MLMTTMFMTVMVVDSKEEDRAADRGDDKTDEATHLVDWIKPGVRVKNHPQELVVAISKDERSF